MRRARPAPALKPPGLLLKRWTGLVVLVLLIVPFLVPIPQELRRHPVISPLGDQLHIILLAAMTLFLYWRGPLTGRLGGAALAAAAIGGAIEFVQELFGRQAFLEDFVLDLVGIGLVVGWIGWRGLGRRAGLALVLLLVAVIPYRLRHVPFLVAAAYDARQQFPVLADLERPYDHYLWRGNGAIVTSETVADSPDGAGRVVRFAAETATDWPAADLRIPPSSISRRLDRLEEEGWIARHHAEGRADRPAERRPEARSEDRPDDRRVGAADLRAVEIELTRTGRRLWREMNVSFRRSVQVNFATHLGDDEVDALGAVLGLLAGPPPDVEGAAGSHDLDSTR